MAGKIKYLPKDFNDALGMSVIAASSNTITGNGTDDFKCKVCYESRDDDYHNDEKFYEEFLNTYTNTCQILCEKYNVEDIEDIDWNAAFKNDTEFLVLATILANITNYSKIDIELEDVHYGYSKEIDPMNRHELIVPLLTLEKFKHYIKRKCVCKNCGHEWHIGYSLDPRYYDTGNAKDINPSLWLNLYASHIQKQNEKEGS